MLTLRDLNHEFCVEVDNIFDWNLHSWKITESFKISR